MSVSENSQVQAYRLKAVAKFPTVKEFFISE
jgi:hypothetical protein